MKIFLDSRFALIFIVVAEVVLLGWPANTCSPGVYEIGHLPAGITHWQFGNYDLYRVNPPLPRMVAAIPVLLMQPKVHWWNYSEDPLVRAEHPVGKDFIRANKSHVFWFYTLGRWACISFSIIGAYLSFRWAKELYGMVAGLIACALWIFCPSILGLGGLMMPDIPVTALGLVACYTFWRWLKTPTWIGMLIASVTLALAMLSKFTAVIFYPMLPILWILYRLPKWRTGIFLWRDCLRQGGMILVLLLLSVYIINCGYLFEGTFTPLEKFRFQTMALTGYDSLEKIPPDGANRFDGTWLGHVPVPLPANMVQGIDTQRLDFERGLPSYVRGQHSVHGWWWYYLYALVVKMPLGTWGLLGLAVVCTVFLKGYNAVWRDEMVVVLPGVVLFVFVSSQTGFSVHSRYIIPALPFLFIWISKVELAFSKEQLVLYPRSTKIVRGLTVFFLGWMVISSLWIYPHSLSYFNELAAVLPTPEDKNYPEQIVQKADANGSLFMAPFRMLDAFFTAGPKNGPRHLLDSNIDWGQDLFYLEDWYEAHPEARPFRVAYWGSYPLELSKIDSAGYPPIGPDSDQIDKNVNLMSVGPLPGYYAVSVNEIYGRSKQYRYFLHFEPVAMAGYSIYIYHITLEDANRVRREMGLPEIEEGEARILEDKE